MGDRARPRLQSSSSERDRACPGPPGPAEPPPHLRYSTYSSTAAAPPAGNVSRSMAGGEPGGAGSGAPARPAHVSRTLRSQNWSRPGRPRPLPPASRLARRKTAVTTQGARFHLAAHEKPGLHAQRRRARDAVYRPPQTLSLSFSLVWQVSL